MPEVREHVDTGGEQQPHARGQFLQLRVVVRRLAEAEVAERRIRLLVDRTARPRSASSQVGCRRSSAIRSAGSSEPSSRARRPSSRGCSSTTRTTPRRSPSRLARSSNVPRERSARAGIFTANVNPAGADSRQRTNGLLGRKPVAGDVQLDRRQARLRTWSGSPPAARPRGRRPAASSGTRTRTTHVSAPVATVRARL